MRAQGRYERVGAAELNRNFKGGARGGDGRWVELHDQHLMSSFLLALGRVLKFL